MRTATAGWAAAAAAIVLSACTATVAGTASPGGPPDLGTALSGELPGFRPVDPPPPPWQLCATAPGTPAPRLDPALGEPVAAGRTSGEVTLHVYAWATSVPMVAEAVLGQAEAEVPDCALAAPPPDAGAAARVVRSVDDGAGAGWGGVRIRTEAPGPAGSVGETRLVRSEEVVVLVVAAGGEPVSRVVDEHLAAVSDRLG
jgi:hypothetical protein